MMSLAGKWRRRGIDVDFAALSADPTIEAWSRLVGVDALEPAVSAAPTAPAAEGAFPLAPTQHAMWVGRHDGQPLGGVAGRLYVEFDGGAIDPERLTQATTSLARRYPMLRVRFLSDGTQQIDAASKQADLAVTVHDFRDHRVKISGYRVEIGEVEVALRQIPGVATAVAAVVSATGGGGVLAAAIHANDPELTADRVRAAMADLVPAHMIPQHLSFVDHVPYTLAGKIDRRVVTGQLTAAVADASAPDHRAPSTPVESAIAAIVGDVVGVDSVGVDDDFFALGDDSVLATQAVARIRAWLDTPDATVADIFATRTVSALAGLLGRRESDPGRLEQVAELYLEVIGMDAGQVVAAVAGNEAVQ